MTQVWLLFLHLFVQDKRLTLGSLLYSRCLHNKYMYGKPFHENDSYIEKKKSALEHT